jgi:L-alanine-DL-glutamate epimerase-like enolase superfamily enzyme
MARLVAVRALSCADSSKPLALSPNPSAVRVGSSAAGLHLALTFHIAATVEVGGPIMLDEDVGGLRACYERDRVTVPEGPSLGIEPNEAVLKRYAGERAWITA